MPVFPPTHGHLALQGLSSGELTGRGAVYVKEVLLFSERSGNQVGRDGYVNLAVKYKNLFRGAQGAGSACIGSDAILPADVHRELL